MLKNLPWKQFLATLLAALLAVLGNRQLPSPSPAPTPPPEPAPAPEAPKPTTDPLKAIGKLIMSGGMCSGTVVTPPDANGHQIIMSASHCVQQVGERCSFYTRGGLLVPVVVKAINRGPDISLLETDQRPTPLEYMELAVASPAVGTPVMHCGFGIDKPGNVEKGVVTMSDTGSGQVEFRLSVSPGDSGGGICIDGQGRVISPVCCTTNVGAVGSVYGGRPEEARKMLQAPMNFLGVPPMRMPPAPKLK